jgi:hypothetical protein
MRRSLAKLALAAALVAVPFAVGTPAAHADCTPLDTAGELCTTGDPATGSFGVGLHAAPLNLCIVIQASCP